MKTYLTITILSPPSTLLLEPPQPANKKRLPCVRRRGGAGEPQSIQRLLAFAVLIIC